MITSKIITYIREKALHYAEDAFNLLDSESRRKVLEDLARIKTWDSDNLIPFLKHSLYTNPPFRSIFLYRITKSGISEALTKYNKYLLFYPAPPGIEIYGDIEGGLRIMHNNCVICVESAGKNLSVGPFAVIGKKGAKAPIIGDNVNICANSTVIGGIHLGDNSLVGASSLVYKDVAPGEVVGGNPARHITYR